jgi:hypothetical protein
MKKFSTGAVRSSDADSTRYDLISPIALSQIASISGKVEWKSANTILCLNGAINNKLNFLGGDRDSEYLAYSAFLLMAAIELEHTDNPAPTIEIDYSNEITEVRYDLIPYEGLHQVACTHAEGASKYGEFNWERGMPVSDLQNHSIKHIRQYMKGDSSEPHLAHAAWGDFASMHSLQMWPHLNTRLRGKDCSLTPEIEKYLAEFQRNKDANNSNA